MAKLNKLKDIEIQKAKPKDKEYFLNDGGGLRILVKKSGDKIWEFRYTINNRRRKTSIKSYPLVSLLQARAKREEYQALLNQGLDPITTKQEAREEQKKEVEGNFKAFAYEWIKKESERLSPTTLKRYNAIFEKDIFPFIADKHLNEITTADIVEIINAKKDKAHEMASRTYDLLKNLFAYAVLKNHCEQNLLLHIRKSDIIRPKEAKHHAKITDPIILKELITALYTYHGDTNTKNALKFCLHIPLRAENLCGLKWEWVNFEDRTITIPRHKMKLKNLNLDDFVVPLSDEVIAILKEQYTFTSSKEFVFMGVKNRHLNTMTPTRALERLGFNNEEQGRKIRLHGFRGTFRSLIDTLDIEGRFSFETKEKALDHHEKNAVVRAYNHKANHIKQLREMFEFWSEYLLSLKNMAQ